MAFGRHWEWRGFGDVDDAFYGRYRELNFQFGPQKVEDLYIWAPDLQVNIKIREGELGGLKFKRLVERNGRFECWSEDPAQLFEFPLQEGAWQMLAVELAATGIEIGPFPQERPDSREVVSVLEGAGCQMVPVLKEREGRWWPGPNGRVLVERTAIHKPQPVLSISLESEEVGGVGLTHDEAKEDLRAAIEALDLERERLAVLSYMDALELWAEGRIINW